MKKALVVSLAALMSAGMALSANCYAEEAAEWEKAYLAFELNGIAFTDGVLSWNPETSEWKADYPTPYGDMAIGGTFAEDGTMTVTEDNSGGHAGDYLAPIQEAFAAMLDGERCAPLSFSLDVMEVVGGTLSWNEESGEWSAAFPTMYGDMLIGGDFAEDGALNVTEDNSGGHADMYVPAIQEVFDEAVLGNYQETQSLENDLVDNALSDEVEAYETENTWKRIVADIAREYDPEDSANQENTIFYGASNFWYWETMQDDLQPFSVQNHAFGGSTDKDLHEFAQFMLYPYNPKFVFFQTGSNDYVMSEAETDELKVEEAMTFKKQMFADFHEQLPNAKFIVMSGILLPGRAEYVDMTLEINDQLKAFCDETDYMVYVDAEALTYDREAGAFVDGVESLFNDDQIHLTDAARITWAENWILPMMEELGAPLAENGDAAESTPAVVVESVEEAAE